MEETSLSLWKYCLALFFIAQEEELDLLLAGTAKGRLFWAYQPFFALCLCSCKQLRRLTNCRMSEFTIQAKEVLTENHLVLLDLWCALSFILKYCSCVYVWVCVWLVF